MILEFNPEPNSVNQKMWRVKDPKSHETRAQTPVLASPSCRGRGWFPPAHGFAEHSRLWPTNQNSTFTVKSRNITKKAKQKGLTKKPLEWVSIKNVMLFFEEWRTKRSRHLVPKQEPILVFISPFYLWDRNRTTQMGRGELLHSIQSSPQERKNKPTPNPKNLH